jgi:Protein of unknown function (DUF1638)
MAGVRGCRGLSGRFIKRRIGRAVPPAERRFIAAGSGEVYLGAMTRADPHPPIASSAQKLGPEQKVLVIACGALAREVRAVLDANRLGHIELTCLPAQWHNRPEKIAGGVRAVIDENRGRYARFAVAYAECGTQGALDRVCEEEGVLRIAGPHCYAFYSGTEKFLAAGDADMDAFYLTDFLARQFHAFVIEPLGLDRHPELRSAYFGNYRRLIYLAQSEDPELDARAEAAAEQLGLTYEKRVTGLGDLASFLTDAPAPA